MHQGNELEMHLSKKIEKKKVASKVETAVVEPKKKRICGDREGQKR